MEAAHGLADAGGSAGFAGRGRAWLLDVRMYMAKKIWCEYVGAAV